MATVKELAAKYDLSDVETARISAAVEDEGKDPEDISIDDFQRIADDVDVVLGFFRSLWDWLKFW